MVVNLFPALVESDGALREEAQLFCDKSYIYREDLLHYQMGDLDCVKSASFKMAGECKDVLINEIFLILPQLEVNPRIFTDLLR